MILAFFIITMFILITVITFLCKISLSNIGLAMASKKIFRPILVLAAILLFSCSETNNNPLDVEPQGYLYAFINGRYFYTNDVSIPFAWLQGGVLEIYGRGDNDEIALFVEANPGNYSLGVDSGQAGYWDKTSTTHFYWAVGWSTDGTTGGQVNITEIERNKKVVGTFDFTVKINGELISITNGEFSIRNVSTGKMQLPTE